MSADILPHEHFMKRALDQARQALELDEVPVGAIIVKEQRIIAAAHNLTRKLCDPTAHAEMIAITQAAQSVGDWRLEHCTLYVTLEPCTMCAGAVINSRIPTVVIGTMDPKAGAAGSVFQVLDEPRLNHCCEMVSGVNQNECGRILTDFFQSKRMMKKKKLD
jgi:tRNA(adenine34) deaminase